MLELDRWGVAEESGVVGVWLRFLSVVAGLASSPRVGVGYTRMVRDSGRDASDWGSGTALTGVLGM